MGMTISYIKTAGNLSLRADSLSIIRILSGRIYQKDANSNFSIPVSENEIVINGISSECDLQVDKSANVLLYTIPSEIISELSIDATELYSISTAIYSHTQVEELIHILDDAFTSHFQSGALSAADSLRYSEKFCVQLLKYIHKVPVTLSSKNDFDKVKILQFLESNYMNPLTLDSVATHLGYSSSYFSKYFKNLFGQLFLDYLHELRLDHVIQELKTTDNSISDIALANGFNSLSSFNSLFKKRFQTTPTSYKKQLMKEAKKTPVIPLSKASVESEFSGADEEIHSIHASFDEVLAQCMPCWNSVINIGAAKELLSASVQSQIRFLQENLHFTYGRIWSLLGKDTMIDPEMSEYNFLIIDQILDFLVYSHIKPFIVLGFKPKQIIKSAVEEYLYVSEPERMNLNSELYYELTRKLLMHCVERYGKEEVSSWKFEQWWPRPGIHGKVSEKWYTIFSLSYDAVHSVVPEAAIGWAAFNIYDNMETVKEYLLYLSSHWKYPRPDFLSVVAYPYVIGENAPISTLSWETPLLLESISNIRPAMEQAGITIDRLYVTELNVSMSNRNPINDSCIRASHYMKNVSLLAGQSKIIAPWAATDLTDIFFDTSKPLYGGAGLITCSGIRKPIYYAIQFLSDLGDELLYHDAHTVITKKGKDIAIVLNNFQPLDESYTSEREGVITAEEIIGMCSSAPGLPLTITLDHVANGQYTMITRRMRETKEGLLEKWTEISSSDYVFPDWKAYLSNVSVPSVSLKTVTVTSETLSFSQRLEPYEIQTITLSMKN